MASLSRILAVLIKELIQLKRDRMTFAMMLGIPVMQLIVFGFAINMDPKHLPAAIHSAEDTFITRALLKGFENSGYYHFTATTTEFSEGEALLASGQVAFVLMIPEGFTRDLIRRQRPQILIEADATDPAASSNAIARAQGVLASVMSKEFTGSLAFLLPPPSPIELVVQPRYNPEGITQYNIVPGLLGVILTMTSVLFTAMAMTREAERGNLENILAMPVRPAEMMVGKILPYILVGAVQTTVILGAAHFLFHVPFVGKMSSLLLGVAIFILANLALGFTFSTIAQTQMQAMQMTFFFFLPSILLSGFMFPFRGMPGWAQTIGEALPLTHFLRIVRGVMLKGNDLFLIQHEFYALLAFIIVVGGVAMLRYRRTLD